MSIHGLPLHRTAIGGHANIASVSDLVWYILRNDQTLHAWSHGIPSSSLSSHFMKSFIFGKRIGLLSAAALVLLDALSGML